MLIWRMARLTIITTYTEMLHNCYVGVDGGHEQGCWKSIGHFSNTIICVLVLLLSKTTFIVNFKEKKSHPDAFFQLDSE